MLRLLLLRRLVISIVFITELRLLRIRDSIRVRIRIGGRGGGRRRRIGGVAGGMCRRRIGRLRVGGMRVGRLAVVR